MLELNRMITILPNHKYSKKKVKKLIKKIIKF